MHIKWWRIIARIWRLLDRITPFEFIRVIKDREEREDYLVRYYFGSTRPMFEWLARHVDSRLIKYSRRCVIHNMKRSDMDGLHDHKWEWSSRILEGGYIEETPSGERTYTPEDGWRTNSANFYHRLKLIDGSDEDVWTFFVMGPIVKDWNFLDKNGNPVHYEEYLENRERYI